MDFERQKGNFRNHVATFIDLGNIKILDFKAPNSSFYRIRFLFEEDSNVFEWAYDLGKKSSGIVELYLMAFELAGTQLAENK